jgi:hypothetical protein
MDAPTISACLSKAEVLAQVPQVTAVSSWRTELPSRAYLQSFALEGLGFLSELQSLVGRSVIVLTRVSSDRAFLALVRY